MKRFRLLALTADRDTLLRELLRRGCVQVSDASDRLDDPEWAELAHKSADHLPRLRVLLNDMLAAVETLRKTAEIKKPFFRVRETVSMTDFLSEQTLARAQELSADINQSALDLSSQRAEIGRLQNEIAALTPWAALDLPLDQKDTRGLSVSFFTVPRKVELSVLREALNEAAPAHSVEEIGSDEQLRYACLLTHPAETDDAWAALKALAASPVSFKAYTGTVKDNLRDLNRRIDALEEQIKQDRQSIIDRKDDLPFLEMAVDRLNIDMKTAESSARLLEIGSVFFLDGWVSAPAMKPLQEGLEKRFACAFEALDPLDEEEPPIQFKNNWFTKPFNMVTNMYALPRYRNIDPNPLMSVFYAVFFGMMYADAAYGLALIAISIIVCRKFKPKGMMGYMFPLMGICGVTSLLWGVALGGYFSDAIDVIAKNVFGYEGKPLVQCLLNPLEDPMVLLIVALGIGVVHLLFGMGVKAYLCFRDGHPWDALWDVGSFWLLFAGIAVLALGGTPYVMVAGFVALILTQGRHKKGIVRKLLSGLMSLYDLTGYISDVLSYSRLMALGLAGGVLGSVFNTMGAMMIGAPGTAGFFLGLVFFLAIFLVGHVFNMAINIIGTYVHAARLQYLEFFSKFYESGGAPFTPLTLETTKFVDVEADAG